MGSLRFSLLASGKQGVKDLYGLEVAELPARPLPKSAYYPPRRRYRAEKLLDSLDAEAAPGSGCDLLVGFTSEDISTTKGAAPDWGIFGLSPVPGRAVIVSTKRLSRGRAGPEKAAQRTVKVVDHELGHALGLEHCPVKDCLMEDAAGTIKTVDAEPGSFCPNCRARVERRLGRRLP